MARTSKTKIGGGEGEQADRATRAAASGAEAVAQAHGQVLQQHRAGADQANQNAALANQVVGQGLDRNQQESQFSRGLEQRKSETALEGAKAGFEQGGDDRSAKLEAEMQKGEGQPKIGALDPASQQRLNEQAEQPLEQDSNGRWRPTKERTDKLAREQKREDFQADTERIRALAYRDQVGVSAQKALASGDKDAYEENVARLVATPNDMQKRYDRLMKNDINTNDWSELGKLAKDSDEMDPTLGQDIKAQQFTPRVAAFVRAQVQKDALTSIVLSKGSTNKLEVDWTAPKMREFQDQVNSINDFMRTNPSLGMLASIRSTEDKMRFLNVLAASKVLMGMTTAPSPTGGMTPATTKPPEGAGAPAGRESMGPAHSSVPGREEGAAAVRQARAGGASPSESLQAGQKVHPTNPDLQPRPKMPGYHELRRSGL